MWIEILTNTPKCICKSRCDSQAPKHKCWRVVGFNFGCLYGPQFKIFRKWFVLLPSMKGVEIDR
jgi:hypothetical protein